MKLLALNEPRVLRFVEDGIMPFGEGINDPQATTIGVEEDGDLVAGVIYHNYSGAYGTIELSAYSTTRSWTDRSVVRFLFDYPFYQLGCRQVLARHSEHNSRARRIWNALGGIEVRLPKMRSDTEDEIVAILTKQAWETSRIKGAANGQK